MLAQRTLKTIIGTTGVGLHTGQDTYPCVQRTPEAAMESMRGVGTSLPP